MYSQIWMSKPPAQQGYDSTPSAFQGWGVKTDFGNKDVALAAFSLTCHMFEPLTSYLLIVVYIFNTDESKIALLLKKSHIMARFYPHVFY